MEEPSLPPYVLPILTAMGTVGITLFSVNVGLMVIQHRDVKEYGKTSRLGSWSWGISLASLFVVYLAPISLVMASLDIVKIRKTESTKPHAKRPPRMAVINSIYAMLCLVLIFGLFILRWTE